MRRLSGLAAAILCGLLAAPPDGGAQDAGHMHLIPDAAAIRWQPGPPDLPKGTQIAVLAGDPGQPGPFVLRVRFPRDSLVPPHRHATAENLTVLSGTLHHAMGERLDRERSERLGPGAFVFLPGMMPHSVWTSGEESVVQVTGTGPFGLIYVNPADSPARAR
ncbi:cupin domain-containing protein [Paracraurococcus ruber]|uniref:Cupin n=1 Tax=Paracraurococcus ruber TaxID=77675 RepID=A0ABS1D1I9_9PROT|nr:cupin domain-containing protein [Paracraurococcus ruber]MBK1660686.1 cupin [Paracraurococcus ruber]TDG31597.1 cupin domain-containing protein [Paracraurococcus ruber]